MGHTLFAHMLPSLFNHFTPRPEDLHVALPNLVCASTTVPDPRIFT